MPNYNITVTAGYKPYTFDEMIKPLQLYKTEYDKQVQAAESLGLEAAKRLQFLDPTLDGDKYIEYKNTLDEINALGDDIASNGINGNSLGRAMDVRRRFQAIVTPLDYALEAREKDKELYKRLQIEHPEILVSRDPFTTPVSSYYPGSQLPSMSSINLNTIYTQSKEASEAFAKQFSDADVQRLDDNFYKYIEVKGLAGDPETVMKQFPQFASMQKRIEDSLDLSKFNKDQKILIRNKIEQGIRDGISSSVSTKTGIKNDPTAVARWYASRGKNGSSKVAQSPEESAEELRRAFGSQPTGEIVEALPTSRGVRDAVIQAKKYLDIKNEKEAIEYDKDYWTGAGTEGWGRFIQDTKQRPGNGTFNPYKVGAIFKPIFKHEKVEKKRVGDNENPSGSKGNYVEIRSTDKNDIVDYEVDLENPNTPDYIKKNFIKTFEALGIPVHQGSLLSDLQKQFDAVTSRESVTVETNTGKVVKVKTDNNTSFAEISSVQLKLTPEDAKKAIGNMVVDMVQVNGKFKYGAVRELKGASSIDGNYAGNLEFGSETSPEDFMKAINDASAIRLASYSGKDKGIIVTTIKNGKAEKFFVNAESAPMVTTFTKLLKDPKLQEHQRNKDRGIHYKGHYIPYLNFVTPEIEQQLKMIKFLDAKYREAESNYSLTAAEKKTIMDNIEKEVDKLRKKVLFKSGNDVITLGDLYEAADAKLSYIKDADALNRAFASSYLNNFKGETYDNNPTVAQKIKYGLTEPDYLGGLIVPDDDEDEEEEDYE